jgi:hypothetical protein
VTVPVNTSRTTNYEFELAFGVHTCRLDHYYFYIYYLSLKTCTIIKILVPAVLSLYKTTFDNCSREELSLSLQNSSNQCSIHLPPHLCHQQTNHHARQQDTHDTQAHG